MPRSEWSSYLVRIDKMAEEINAFVPRNQIQFTDFRADLAGLLVVAIAASYESCVRETIVNYTGRTHRLFGLYAARNYERLNSRIAISDLYQYTRVFGDNINSNFKRALAARKKDILQRVGTDIIQSYEQILEWRNEFAHTGRRNTTIEEAMRTHVFAKRVMFAFSDAFV